MFAYLFLFNFLIILFIVISHLNYKDFFVKECKNIFLQFYY